MSNNKDVNLEELVLISSTKNTAFAKKIADYLGKSLAETEWTRFKDTDLKVRIAESESVGGKHACLIMTYEPPIAERFHETIVWTDALCRGSLEHLTIVWPYFLGARQDRKTQRGEPINIATYIHAVEGVANTQVSKLGWMTVDLHAPQCGGYSMTHDDFPAMPLFARHIQNNNFDYKIISPDTGALHRNESLANFLGAEMPSCIPEIRGKDGKKRVHDGCGDLDVEGKTAIIVDDMIDSGGTILPAIEEINRQGAKKIVIYASHLLLNPPFEENFAKLENVEIIGTDSVYHPPEILEKFRITQLPVSYVLAEAIKRRHLRDTTRDLREITAWDVVSKHLRINDGFYNQKKQAL